MAEQYISVKLKKTTEELLNMARAKYSTIYPNNKPFDYRVIHEALGVFLKWQPNKK